MNDGMDGGNSEGLGGGMGGRGGMRGRGRGGGPGGDRGGMMNRSQDVRIILPIPTNRNIIIYYPKNLQLTFTARIAFETQYY